MHHLPRLLGLVVETLRRKVGIENTSAFRHRGEMPMESTNATLR